jgi:hypothetical protein
MSSYQFTPEAVEDLFEIWSYVAADDMDAANRVEEAILGSCSLNYSIGSKLADPFSVLSPCFLALAPFFSSSTKFEYSTKHERH